MASKPRTIRAIVQQLVSLEQAGVTHLPKPSKIPAKTSKAKPAAAPPAPSHSVGEERQENVAATPADRGRPAVRLKNLQAKVAQCVLCKELARTRTQTVFGDGNPQSRLVFMGEAPGADEDQQGIPFVGQAGQMLTRIIENVCGMKREDVYILNTIKCRPPGNRTPEPQEAANCRPYLDAQLDIIRPEFICCLGAVAAQNLLNTTERIGKLRGQVWNHQGIKVVCTYHPAYLLRNPAAKRDVWEDIAFLLKEMGIEPKQRPT